jgi:hypothetical protein
MCVSSTNHVTGKSITVVSHCDGCAASDRRAEILERKCAEMFKLLMMFCREDGELAQKRIAEVEAVRQS